MKEIAALGQGRNSEGPNEDREALPLEDHLRFDGYYLSPARVGEQRVAGGECAELLQMLDRREDQHDLTGLMGVERRLGREPAELDALLAIDLRLLSLR